MWWREKGAIYAIMALRAGWSVVREHGNRCCYPPNDAPHSAPSARCEYIKNIFTFVLYSGLSISFLRQHREAGGDNNTAAALAVVIAADSMSGLTTTAIESLEGQYSNCITLLTKGKGARGKGVDYGAVEEVASSSAANQSWLSNAVGGDEFWHRGGNHESFSHPRGR